MNQNLPAFVVLVSAGQGGQPLYARLWGSGFLDSRYQGVRLRSGRDAVLYLSNPDGITQPGYNIADADGTPIYPTKQKFDRRAVHVHDLQATMLKLLGIDHQQLFYKHQGRRFRLTDVHGHVVDDLIA